MIPIVTIKEENLHKKQKRKRKISGRRGSHLTYTDVKNFKKPNLLAKKHKIVKEIIGQQMIGEYKKALEADFKVKNTRSGTLSCYGQEKFYFNDIIQLNEKIKLKEKILEYCFKDNNMFIIDRIEINSPCLVFIINISKKKIMLRKSVLFK